ncbi:MAG: pyridine nucleotide transhydrogenase [Sulfurovum sp. AS07-7]|nr:MAG: pyridine nucleotide transhydrogenase [Sulfurovum sp. AS07-7]
MKKALIGYTGFVGSNLKSQMKFNDFYNSKNIQDIKDKEYDVVYCAGAPAAKWVANQKPTEDLQSISSLIDAIREVKTKRFVLISTVDVYKAIMNVDEDSFIDLSNHHAYGTHRRMIETFVSERFEHYTIIRLPGLFGDGLKKNIIYDFLHDNETFKIHSEAVFQFYSLDTLVEDIQKVIEHDIKLINFATEPTSVKEVIRAGFDIDFENKPTPNAPFYDMRTKYAKVFGKAGTYIQSKQEVLQKVKDFVQRTKAKI